MQPVYLAYPVPGRQRGYRRRLIASVPVRGGPGRFGYNPCMQSKATTVRQYLAELPPDRRSAIDTVRRTIVKSLPKGYAEGMQYGMIGYYVPHSLYPPGYHCDPRQPLPFAALASQKNHMAVYLMCVYGDPAHEAWLRAAWTRSGKKLDMGKSCIRFKKLEDVPLDVIGRAVGRVPVKAFIARYESAFKSAGIPRRKKTAKKKTAVRRTATKKTTPTKQAANKKTLKKKTPAKSAVKTRVAGKTQRSSGKPRQK